VPTSINPSPKGALIIFESRRTARFYVVFVARIRPSFLIDVSWFRWPGIRRGTCRFSGTFLRTMVWLAFLVGRHTSARAETDSGPLLEFAERKKTEIEPICAPDVDRKRQRRRVCVPRARSKCWRASDRGPNSKLFHYRRPSRNGHVAAGLRFDRIGVPHARLLGQVTVARVGDETLWAIAVRRKRDKEAASRRSALVLAARFGRE